MTDERLAPDRIDTSQLFALMRSATGIVEASELGALLDEVVRTAVITTGARYGALGVIGEHGQLSEFHHRGLDDGTVEKIGHLPVGRGVLGTLIRDARPLRLDEITDHADSVGFPPGHPKMGSFLGVPIEVGTQVFGNLYLTDKTGGFTEEDQILVSGLAVLAGAAIRTLKMHRRLSDLAVVEDRERIARDLHDSIIQDLFGMGLAVQALASRAEEADARQLDGVVDRIDAMIVQLRSLIFDLRIPEDTSFRTRMERLLADLARPFETDVRLVTNFDELSDTALDGHLRHIVKEATSNALRHAGAASITVSIDRFPDRLIVAVADTGVGFDPGSVSRGMGLHNVEERVEDLGGEVTIRSGQGAGTMVEVTIPL